MGSFLFKVIQFALGSLIARFVSGVGLSFVTYEGLTALVYPLLDGVLSSLNDVSSEVLNILLLAGLGQALTVIGSAAIARATMVAAAAGMGLRL